MSASGWRPTPSNTSGIAAFLGVLTVILACVVVFVLDAKPIARIFGIVVTILCTVNLGVLVWRLNYTVSQIRRGELSRQLLITVQVTLWVIGVGVFSGSVWWKQPASIPTAATTSPAPTNWGVPVAELLTPSMIVGVLLGMATLLALIITLTEVKEDEVPRAMSFDEALYKAVAFLENQVEQHGAASVHFRMCAYYPNIGVVTRAKYKDAYDRFVEALRRYPVEVVGLRLTDDLPLDGNETAKLADRVCCSRPQNVVEAMVAFARMWDPKNDAHLSNAQSLLKEAVDACRRLSGDLADKVKNRHTEKWWHETGRVPDFHFVVAFVQKETPLRGFLLFGIRPAGMPIPQEPVRDEMPPFVGMEITDRAILRHMLLLWESLREHKSHQGGSPPAIGGTAGSGSSETPVETEPNPSPPTATSADKNEATAPNQTSAAPPRSAEDG